MSESQIFFFALTSLLVILIPGQDMVLVMSRGVTQGAKAGLVTAAGVSIGLLGHTMLATLGVGALLLSSELFFSILKYVGAAYLVYLGVQLILSDASMSEVQSENKKSLGKLFLTGALSNISNPKITVFYFAYLPQFVSSDLSNPEVYLLALGTGFSLLTFLVKAPIGFFAGVASVWIRTRPAVVHVINLGSGAVLIGLGVKLAFAHR